MGHALLFAGLPSGCVSCMSCQSQERLGARLLSPLQEVGTMIDPQGLLGWICHMVASVRLNRRAMLWA